VITYLKKTILADWMKQLDTPQRIALLRQGIPEKERMRIEEMRVNIHVPPYAHGQEAGYNGPIGKGFQYDFSGTLDVIGAEGDIVLDLDSLVQVPIPRGEFEDILKDNGYSFTIPLRNTIYNSALVPLLSRAPQDHTITLTIQSWGGRAFY
jgi:hypothetical protein